MVNVTLSNSSDFDTFKGLTLENMVTKRGRQPFPRLEFRISDLDPMVSYQVYVSFRQHANIMEFKRNTWIPHKTPALPDKGKAVMHEYGIATGKELMRETIKFPLLKITNNENNVSATTICLYSRHKYTPLIHVYPMKLNWLGERENREPLEFLFEEAAFVTVTSYMNQEVKELKINMNKFASQFVKKRAGGQEEDSNEQKKKQSCVETESELEEQEPATTEVQAKEPQLPPITNAASVRNTYSSAGNHTDSIAIPVSNSQTLLLHVHPVQSTPAAHGCSNPYPVAFGSTAHSPAVHSNVPQYYQNYQYSFSQYSTSMYTHHQQTVSNQGNNQHLQQSNGYQGAFPAAQHVNQSQLQFQYPEPATYFQEYQQQHSQVNGTGQQGHQGLYYPHFY